MSNWRWRWRWRWRFEFAHAHSKEIIWSMDKQNVMTIDVRWRKWLRTWTTHLPFLIWKLKNSSSSSAESGIMTRANSMPAIFLSASFQTALYSSSGKTSSTYCPIQSAEVETWVCAAAKRYLVGIWLVQYRGERPLLGRRLSGIEGMGKNTMWYIGFRGRNVLIYNHFEFPRKKFKINLTMITMKITCQLGSVSNILATYIAYR